MLFPVREEVVTGLEQSSSLPQGAHEASLDMELSQYGPAPVFDDTENALVNVNSNISDDFDNATFWPYSTAWQWTHEDLYLQGDAGLGLALEDPNGLVMDLGMDGPVFQSQRTSGTSIDSRLNGPSLDHLLIGSPRAEGSLSSLVDSIVASACTDRPSQTAGHTARWRALSRQLSRLVDAPNTDGEGLFDRLVDQYFHNFHPLWATFPRGNGMPPTDLHPLLFLTATSIGALYSGTSAAASYGSIMHKRLRVELTHQTSQTDLTESEALDLGRALLLTQVAALYFEHDNAFSAAQQLSATLSAHTHRMRLFTLKSPEALHHASTKQRKSAMLLEGRKMLAFGILRAETFMSILFNKKPLVSSEEVNLPLPFAHELPDGPSTSSKTPLPGGGLLFSDLIRIALDEEEILPSLRPFDLELALFGLQHETWRFSQDPNIFLRLIQISCAPSRASSSSIDEASDPLDYTGRRMRQLIDDYHRVKAALEKWKKALSHCQLSHRPEENRTSYLSSLILHQLSLLRLCAPVDIIQQAAYQSNEPSVSGQQVVASISRWAASRNSDDAIKHARCIWQMLARESSRPPETQAKYNILALIALHHAAVVIWAVAGTNWHVDDRFIGKKTADHAGEDAGNDHGLALRRENTRELMLQFADLYPSITSSWGMQSSFFKMVRRLAEHPLPSFDRNG
jgi:hypothetical protein